MNSLLRRASAVCLLLMWPILLTANDSAASVAVGGIVLTRQPKISMESERLTISLSKISVEYEFLNESDADISTEVAFPIPPYEYTESAGGIRSFGDFKLLVDGQEVKYQVESKAFLQKYDKDKPVGPKRDVTATLQKYNIDIPSLGHFTTEKDYKVADFDRLSPATRKLLAAQQLVDVESDGSSRPSWEVHKTYHWQQTFPSHKILKVRHEYAPGFGFEGIAVAAFDPASRAKFLKDYKESARYDLGLLKDSCVEPSLQKTVYTQASAALKADPNNGYVPVAWVDYILTTANSWKTPIKKFDLVIERGPKRDQYAYQDDWTYASLCWDGNVTRVGSQHFEASETDFIPTKELKVLFLRMPGK